MNRLLILIISAISVSSILSAQATSIEMEFQNFDQDTILFGYHFGNKQYIKDTLVATTHNDTRTFTYTSDTLQLPGIYLAILPPENEYVQILLPEDDQVFKITVDASDMNKGLTANGSLDNEIFIDYIDFLSDLKVQAEQLNEKKKVSTGQTLEDINTALKAMDQQVKDKQAEVQKKYPNSMTALILRTAQDVSMPTFEGNDEDIKRQQYWYYRTHFFDNIDFKDDRLIRTNIIFPKVEQYITKLIPQHPDSITVAIGDILGRMDEGSDMFQFFIVHFLNESAASQVVGHDAIYVYLVDEYYNKGKATWVDEESLAKIVKNAKTLKPILIGKQAPNLVLLDKEDQEVSLYDIQSPYTILFFWEPSCSHCKKAAPYVAKLEKDLKDKGVKVISICTSIVTSERTVDQVKEECWKGVIEKQFHDLVNLYDPYMRSRYKSIYDIKSTPMIYILDKDKKIIMKKLGAEQLEEVMNQIITMDANKEADNN